MTRFLSAIAGIGLILLAGLPASGQTVERPRVTISIGSYVVGFLPLPLAHALGHFREQGTDVEIQNFQAGGSKSLQALIGGSTDAVVGSYDHTVQMQAQGKDIRCVIQLNRTPGIVAAVRKDLAGRIRTIADLKDATVGISLPGSGLDFIFRHLIASAGLTSDDMRIVAVGSGQNAIAAVENRAVDAIVHLDPAITVMQRKGAISVIFDTRSVKQTHEAFGGDYPLACLYTTADFIDRNPVTVQRLVNAFAKTLAFIHGHSAAEIADVLPAEYQVGGREIFIEILKASTEVFPAVGRFNPADLDRPRRILAVSDEKVRTTTIDIEKTYTNRFVDAVPDGNLADPVMPK
jgi:NitT/TauT family transport system substrate-binding protein